MVLKRLILALALLLAVAFAQSEKPLLAGGTLLTAVYPGDFGVSYVEVQPFARALGLLFWQDQGQLILGLGARRLRYVATPLPASKTALKKLVTSEQPSALRDGDRVLIPLRATSRALGALYSGSEASLRVLLPEAVLRGLSHRVEGGRDVLVLKLDRDLNAAPAGAGSWWLLGLRTEEQVREVLGLYLSRVRFEPGPYGARLVLEGAEGWPVEVAYFPSEVRFYVGPRAQAATERRPLVVLDPGHGGDDDGVRYGNLAEKTIVLKVAREAAERLRRRGYRVVLTRDGDENPSVYSRAQWAAKADVFISLHVAGSPAVPPGPVLYRYAGSRADVPVFVARARTLLDRGGFQPVLRRYARSSRDVAALSDAVEEAFGRIGLSARRAETPLYLLEHAPGAALLVELGSLTDANDRARLSNAAQQSAYAQVIARAVARFLGGQP
ncbi:N-acetylmuramoyl-L-alanine amidase family protein [Deinococcota bacterium DY0809b]